MRIKANPSLPSAFEAWDLSEGESQVLAAAMATQNSLAFWMIKRHARCAQTFDIPVFGTLSVVLRAKRKTTSVRRILRYLGEPVKPAT